MMKFIRIISNAVAIRFYKENPPTPYVVPLWRKNKEAAILEKNKRVTTVADVSKIANPPPVNTKQEEAPKKSDG